MSTYIEKALLLKNMKIFITGCARSGTTLLKRLFRAFDADVINPEISVSAFVKQEDNGVLVGKRELRTIMSNALPTDKEHEQLITLLEHDVKIVNILRNGPDTIESGYTSPERWLASLRAYTYYRYFVTATVFYKDLVYYPEAVQEMLQKELEIDSIHSFSDYPAFAVKEPDRQGEIYPLRPVSTEGVDKKYDWHGRVPCSFYDQFRIGMLVFDQVYREDGLSCS